MLPVASGIALFVILMVANAAIYIRNSGLPARFLAGPGGVLSQFNYASHIRTKRDWLWQCIEKVSFGISLGAADGLSLSPESPRGAAAKAEYEIKIARYSSKNPRFYSWRPAGWDMMESLAVRGEHEVIRLEWWSVGWPLRSFWMIRTFPNGVDPVFLAGSPNTALDGMSWIPGSLFTELHSLPGLPTGVRWWAFIFDLSVFAGGMVVLFNARLGYRFGVRAIRRRRRQCVQCGYPRERLPASSRCPECGNLEGSSHLPAETGSVARRETAEDG